MRPGSSEHVFYLVRHDVILSTVVFGNLRATPRLPAAPGSAPGGTTLSFQAVAMIRLSAVLGGFPAIAETLPRMDRRHPHPQSRRSRHLVKAARDYYATPAFGGDGVAVEVNGRLRGEGNRFSGLALAAG